MKKYLLFVFMAFVCLTFNSQTFTTPTSSLLNNSYHSGGVTGVADMNNDGYDDIIIMDESKNLYVEYQNTDGTFSASYYGVMSGSSQWGMAIGDFNNDGHNDVLISLKDTT